ncbi:hypothetical protein IWZ01DRAFT_477267 [Phyllosticta capitalensis]
MAAALSASAPRAPSPPVSPAELALAISAAMSPFDPFDIPEFNDANEAVPADDDGIMGTPPPPYTAVSSPPPPYEARDPRWLWEGVEPKGSVRRRRSSQPEREGGQLVAPAHVRSAWQQLLPQHFDEETLKLDDGLRQWMGIADRPDISTCPPTPPEQPRRLFMDSMKRCAPGCALVV